MLEKGIAVSIYGGELGPTRPYMPIKRYKKDA
jgi:hypothetical protein